MGGADQGEQLIGKELDLSVDFNEILKAGYTVNLWNTGGSVRVVEILNAGDAMGLHAPLLGFGADGTAAQALVRARDSFTKRVSEGKDVLTNEDMREADAGYSTGAFRDGTYLDAVASLNEITFIQEGNEVMARIPLMMPGTYGIGRGANMARALENLEAIMQGKVC